MIEVTFRYIDCISEQVITDYQHEWDQWMLTQTAVRAGRVRAMLGDKPIDVEATESVLGYRLRQHHLGVVAWVTDAVHGSDGLTPARSPRLRGRPGARRPRPPPVRAARRVAGLDLDSSR
jgi:hypothetical protein